MKNFIGREKELKALNNEYRNLENSFIPIYGRRRVGKSELIKKFIEDKKSLFYLGKQAPEQVQIKEFLESASIKLCQPLLASLATDNWKDAIKSILSQLTTDEKFVIVLDEFQWIVDSAPELPSILQEFIDNEWDNKNIFLILCGSYMGFMEKKVLGEKSPLFGRRTGQMLLKPFTYLEARNFHPHLSIKNQAKIFFICGGIPYYLKFFKENISIDQNIQNNFINEYSALSKEPHFLLREELKDLHNYYGILMALSSSMCSNHDISKTTGIDERKLYYYIQNLVELGYVKRHYPLSSQKASKQKLHIKLQDPLLRFWFRFIFPHQSLLCNMDENKFFLNIIKPNLQSYFGYCFENMCREALAYLYEKENVLCPFEIGEYWSKDVQIDVIGLRKDDRVDICECKWGSIKSFNGTIRNLKEKVKHYPNPDNSTIQLRLFCADERKVATQLPCNIHFLKDLYLT